MKTLIAFLLFSLVSNAVVFTKPDPTINSFFASTPWFSVPANATDMCEIYGSATKVVRVTSLQISTNQTTGATNQIFYIKRSTANTGGGSASPTIVPLDSGKLATTVSSLKYYPGANPTTGTSAGALSITRIFTAPSSTAFNPVVELLMPFNQFQPVVLRGTGQGLVVNFGGTAVPTGFTITCTWRWVEESQ